MRPIVAFAALVVAGCAGTHIAFPSGSPTPSPDALPHWAEATAACRGANVYTAELTVDGLVGSERLRHVVLQGAMTREGRVRLVAVAPAGPAIFTLAGTDSRATLTLPRQERVVRATASEIVAALIGVTLSNADWLHVLSGCVSAAPAAEAVRIGDVTIVSLADRVSRVRLDQTGREWRLTAGERPDLLVEYEEFLGRWPKAVRVASRSGAAVPVNLSMTISQVNVNIDLPESAFALDVPATFLPMTLDELRALGPLAERGGDSR